MHILARAILTVFVAVSAGSALAQSDAELKTIMEGKLVSILTAVEQHEDDTAALAALAANVDFAAITRGVLGKYRNDVNDAQRARFQGEFQKSMLALLRTALKTAGEYRIEVTATRLSEKNAARGQAYATVTTGDRQTIELVSSIARTDDDWKVRNLILAGLNLGLTYRNQFDELMQASGSDIDAAIDAWAEKVVQQNDA